MGAHAGVSHWLAFPRGKEVAMSHVCRVSVAAGDAQVDLGLPSGVAVGSLIPAIADIVGGEPRPYWLSVAGAAPLDISETLAQQGVRDGTLLVLSPAPTPAPARRFDDVADAVATSLTPGAEATRLCGALAAGWLATVGVLVVVAKAFWLNEGRQAGAAAGVFAVAGAIALSAGAIAHRGFHDTAAGLTLGVLATGCAATAGLLAVPGGPGAPNALLAAAAGAATAALSRRIIGCGTSTLTAVGSLSMVAVGAASVAVSGAAPLRAIGATCAVVSLGLVELSPRMSLWLAGLSPHLAVQAAADRPVTADIPATATRSDALLTGLVAGFAASAALGAVGALTGEANRTATTFAAITGVVLLARSRSHIAPGRAVALAVSGSICLSAAFVVAAADAGRLPWIAMVTAALTAVALVLCFLPPAVSCSPLARRSAELAEYVALAALVPLACWLCGLYGAARGVRLS
jgi:type VII secretion integral membrane protein EccD